MFEIKKHTYGKESKLPGSEAALQKACIEYLEWLPAKPLFFHCPNGGSRNKIEAAKLKAQGVKAGVPDVLVIQTAYVMRKINGMTAFMHTSPGLAIELKAKGGRLKKEQEDWLEALYDRGWEVAVCYTFDSFKLIIDNYLKHAR